MKSTKLIAVLATSFILGQAFADTDPVPTYKLLSQRRSEVQLPEYNLDQKKLVIDQVRLALRDLFVHRELKMQHFGNEIDPLPLLDKLEEKIEELSDAEFHTSIAQIFNKQKDWHTTYSLPKPYSCYRNLLPFTFEEISTPEGSAIVINKIVENKEALDLLPEPLKVSLGDTLVSYNGYSVPEMFKLLAPRSLGANPAADRRSIVDMLALLSQKLQLAPTMDTVKLVMKTQLGETYETTVPWISRAFQDCLKPKTADGNALSGANEYLLELNKTFRENKKFKKIKNAKSNLASGYTDTAEPILKYKILKNSNGTFGVLRLESFVPEVLSVPEVIVTVKKLLLNELKNTDGMILDLRNNGGGMIGLGEGLVQLFTPKNIQRLNFVLKSSLSNKHFMDVSYQGSPFLDALNEALANNQPYTSPLPLSPSALVNTHGQVYFKPLALFTNASCYSTCDMISALVQDHEVGLIVGEDNTTGAGGANNVKLMSFYEELPENNKGPYKLMPGGQDVGLSWRQTSRVGKHAGELIEDTGVLSDMIVPATMKDILNDSTHQFKIISDQLVKMAPAYRSSVEFKADNLELLADQKPTLFMKWTETTSIELRKNDELLKTIDIQSESSEGQQIDLSGVIDTSQLGIENLEVRGFFQGKRVWRRVLSFRIIPPTFILDPKGLSINFNSPHPMAIYGQNGWNVLNGSLKIHDGVHYLGNVKSDASLFVNLPVAIRLKFDAEIKTEADYDYFRVLVVTDGKETFLEKGISGQHEMKTFDYDLSPFAGKNVEIRFVFESDGFTEDVGVTLDNISIY